MNDFSKRESSQEGTTSRVPKENKLKLLHKKGLYTLEVVDGTQEYDAYEYDKETQTTTYYRYVFPEISDEVFIQLSYGKDVDLGIPKCTKELIQRTKTIHPTPKPESDTKHQNKTKFYLLDSGPNISAKGLRSIGVCFLMFGILDFIATIIICILGEPLYIFVSIVSLITCFVTYLIFNTVANISDKTDAIVDYLIKEQRNKE